MRLCKFVICWLSTLQYIEFYRTALLANLLSITMGKSTDGVIVEAMDDKAAGQEGKERGKRKPMQKLLWCITSGWSPHTTANSTEKAQTITDREITATKTAQEEINDKQWDCTHGQSMIPFPPMADG
jgi:hypothetical protein